MKTPQLISPQRGTPELERSTSRSRHIDKAEISHNGRIASAFRAIVEAGRFVEADRFFLEASLKRGLLAAGERRMAKKMLEQLDENKSIERGYRRAKKGAA